MRESPLEGIAKEEKKPSAKKIALVDTLGNVTYSIIVGSMLDYSAGLRLKGIISSRATATGINTITGGPYGWWREKMFKWTNTKSDSNKIRKYLVDLLAFNTFQIPVYATALSVGTLIEGEYDFSKVANGIKNLAMISPLIGPTMGWYMDGFRRLFGIKSASKGAYKENK